MSPLIEYVSRKFSADSERVISQAREICEGYQAQGLDLTLRQLFYQFVSRDLLPNSEQSYKRIGAIINDARLAGLLDWQQIVDRTRVPARPNNWKDATEIITGAARGFQMDKWADQDTYVEVWIEKEALAGVLASCCPGENVTYFSCRGYASASATWRAARRLGMAIEAGKRAVVIHLGDHDPSGIDMTRDIEHRLGLFIAQDVRGADPGWDVQDYLAELDDDLQVRRIALNFDQIEQYKPPPNPAKLTDSRAARYVQRFGRSSWELDALDPATLVGLIQAEIKSHRDAEKWEAAVQLESEERIALTALEQRWGEVKEFLS